MGILKIPRITEAQRSNVSFIPQQGELFYVSDNKKIYKGDGTTAGGIEVTGGGGGILYATTTGTNTYVANPIGAPLVYTAGDSYLIKFAAANTGASTINVGGAGAKTIVKNAATALASGDIIANKIYLITYDGTNFQLLTIGGSGIGDMLKSVYDTDDDGVVDKSEVAEVANRISIIARNNTASTITKGKIVYLLSAGSSRPTIELARADSGTTSNTTFGVVVSDIAPSSEGEVCTIGTIDSIDTRNNVANNFTIDNLTAGDSLWLSATTAGNVTKTRPTGFPNNSIFIGKVALAGSSGRIIYNINGFPLMGGATSVLAGSAGLVPPANAGQQNLFLTGGGTWATTLGTGVITSGLPRRLALYTSASNGVVLDDEFIQTGSFTINVTLASTAITANRTITIPVSATTDGEFIMSYGDQTIAGNKTFNGNILTASPSFSLINTNATIVNFAGAATSLTIANSAPTTGIKTINIGTGIVNGNANTQINIGSNQELSGDSSFINLGNYTFICKDIIDTASYLNPPSLGDRSRGNRLIFRNKFSAGTSADYSMGVGDTFLWFGIPLKSSTNSFKWYGGDTEIMSLDGNGALKVISPGSELPKVHLPNEAPSTGNKFLFNEFSYTVSNIAWENGINFGALSPGTTNPAGSTLAYQNTYLDPPLSGGSNPSVNFINSGAINDAPTGSGQFNFFVPDVTDGPNVDNGFGKGFISPSFSFVRIQANNNSSANGIVIRAPRKAKAKTVGFETKTINAIAKVGSVVTITLNNVTDLVVNQYIGISDVSPSNSLYNGLSARILSIDTILNKITINHSPASNYISGGLVTPIYRGDGSNPTNLYLAFDKNPDFFVPSSAPNFLGRPNEARVIWYTQGEAGDPFYGLFTNRYTYLNNNASEYTPITEKIAFASESKNICIGEAVTAGVLNLFSFNAVADQKFIPSGGTRTINIGNVSLGNTIPTSSVSTNINIGTAVSGLFNVSNTKIFGNIGFYGVTPVPRATTGLLITNVAFVANTGTSVNNSSTFGGYTLLQIAQALKNIGILT